MIEIIHKNNVIHITLNFLGGIKTVAKNEQDIDTAITEAMLCFIEASNKHGLGIRKELEAIKFLKK